MFRNKKVICGIQFLYSLKHQSSSYKFNYFSCSSCSLAVIADVSCPLAELYVKASCSWLFSSPGILSYKDFPSSSSISFSSLKTQKYSKNTATLADTTYGWNQGQSLSQPPLLVSCAFHVAALLFEYCIGLSSSSWDLPACVWVRQVPSLEGNLKFKSR